MMENASRPFLVGSWLKKKIISPTTMQQHRIYYVIHFTDLQYHIIHIYKYKYIITIYNR